VSRADHFVIAMIREVTVVCEEKHLIFERVDLETRALPDRPRKILLARDGIFPNARGCVMAAHFGRDGTKISGSRLAGRSLAKRLPLPPPAISALQPVVRTMQGDCQ